MLSARYSNFFSDRIRTHISPRRARNSTSPVLSSSGKALQGMPNSLDTELRVFLLVLYRPYLCWNSWRRWTASDGGIPGTEGPWASKEFLNWITSTVKVCKWEILQLYWSSHIQMYICKVRSRYNEPHYMACLFTAWVTDVFQSQQNLISLVFFILSQFWTEKGCFTYNVGRPIEPQHRHHSAVSPYRKLIDKIMVVINILAWNMTTRKKHCT